MGEKRIGWDRRGIGEDVVGRDERAAKRVN